IDNSAFDEHRLQPSTAYWDPPQDTYFSDVSDKRRSSATMFFIRGAFPRTGCGATATNPDQFPTLASLGSVPICAPNSSCAAGAAFPSPKKQTARGAR